MQCARFKGSVAGHMLLALHMSSSFDFFYLRLGNLMKSRGK